MSSPAGRGGVFISYRREETAAQAGRLYDRLSDRFGEDRVFMDIDSIAIGLDFTKAIREAVSGCDILLALIGRNWPASADSTGRRRIDDPDDFVRVEIETALQRDIRVVPVLVDGAVLPQAEDLPSSLRPLIRRQAFVLSNAGFRSEVARLLAAVDQVLEPKPGRPARAPRTPAASRIEQGARLREQGLFSEAETAYRTAVTLAPAFAPAHIGLADALYGQERHTEAEAAAREAIRLDPGLANAHNALGNALYGQERYSEAEVPYREAIRLNPADAVLHGNLADVLNDLTRYSEAEAAAREAIRLDPRLASAQYALGNALFALNRKPEAEIASQEAARLEAGS